MSGIKDIRTVLPLELFLGDDDLHRRNVFGLGDRVVQNADAPDDLLLELDSVLEAAFDGVGGVADDHGAVGDTIAVLDSDNLAVFEEDFVDIGVQHEGPTIHSADPGESFRDAAQTVDGVDEGRISIPAHGVGVKLDFADDLDGRQGDKAFIVV